MTNISKMLFSRNREIFNTFPRDIKHIKEETNELIFVILTNQIGIIV